MGAIELVKSGKTTEETVKVEKYDAEIKISQPPKRHEKDAEQLPSPFDSMYMQPTIEIKSEGKTINMRGKVEGSKSNG